MTLADLPERANIARIGEIGLACRGGNAPGAVVAMVARLSRCFGCNAGLVLA